MSEKEPGAARRCRAGMQEVAALAGVGMATVDRVLNERGSVRVDTARRVIEAARTLGLRRTLPMPYHRNARLEVLLARSAETPFLVRLTQAFVGTAATLDRSVTVLRTTLDHAKPQLVARRIRKTMADGLILYCEEHPTILAAIAGAIRRGLPVICLTTDLPTVPRLAYVGIAYPCRSDGGAVRRPVCAECRVRPRADERSRLPCAQGTARGFRGRAGAARATDADRARAAWIR
jgi:hypothetical protein